MEFPRYPHVKPLMSHYASQFGDQHILSLLESDIQTSEDAETFSQFIWKMLDQMSDDIDTKKSVLGSTDNSSMIPDIEYEVSLYLSNQGFEDVWERICDQN